MPLANSGELILASDYGWMDEYERSNANWRLSVYGPNLTDEWYVNGGGDQGLFQGFDVARIGRPREVGVGMQFTFD